MRRYGWREKDQIATPEDPRRCVAQVSGQVWIDRQSHYVERQCSRKRGYGKDGLFCKQHAKQGHVQVPGENSGEVFYVSPVTLRELPTGDEAPPLDADDLPPSGEIIKLNVELAQAEDSLRAALVSVSRVRRVLSRARKKF